MENLTIQELKPIVTAINSWQGLFVYVNSLVPRTHLDKATINKVFGMLIDGGFDIEKINDYIGNENIYKVNDNTINLESVVNTLDCVGNTPATIDMISADTELSESECRTIIEMLIKSGFNVRKSEKGIWVDEY